MISVRHFFSQRLNKTKIEGINQKVKYIECGFLSIKVDGFQQVVTQNNKFHS